MMKNLIPFVLIGWCAVLPAHDGAGSAALKQLQQQVADQGGFAAMEARMKPLRKEIQQRLKASPEGWQFKQGMHRFNKKITASAIKPAWDYQPQPDQGQFLPADVVIDFHRKLERQGIELIFVPVPSKIEAYPEAFATPFPDGGIVSIGRMRTMMRLLEAGVAVVDVLPTMLAAKAEAKVPLYETSGHHLSGLGAKLAGALVAEQMTRLDLGDRDPGRFIAVNRLGTERVDRDVSMQTWQVQYTTGEAYHHQHRSQIAVIGDSNAFAFKGASWASHIARATGVPVADHSTSSGGSFAHLQLAELGLAYLKDLKAVVWIVTSTHLERFGWPMGVMPEQATVRGLAAAGQIDEAFARFEAHQRENPGKPLWVESQMNRMGYALLGAAKTEAAIAVFELNTRAFPQSPNAWDSLGEGLKRAGRNDRAKEAFLHSLSLNPSDSTAGNSKRHLADLGYSPTGQRHKTVEIRQAWPSVRDHLALIVPTRRRGLQAWLNVGETPIFNYALKPKAFAHVDRQGRLSVRHGQFHAPNRQDFLRMAFSGDFTLELFATRLEPKSDGALWRFVQAEGSDLFTLNMEGGRLIFAYTPPHPSSPVLLSYPLPEKAAFHVALSRKGQTFRLYVDGKPVAEQAAPLPKGAVGDQPSLRFGSGSDDESGWSGFLEGIALHRAALDKAALADHAAAYAYQVSRRTRQPVIHLKGRLIDQSQHISLADIAPYRRSLSVYEYEVLEVVAGIYEPKRIRVAHWSLMDGLDHPHRHLQTGAVLDLKVTAFQANPQLRNVHLSDTLGIDFDTELFYQAPY